jgi:hypothetical protein
MANENSKKLMKIKNKELKDLVASSINSMTLSHHKELLPFIFHQYDLIEYYQYFDKLSDFFVNPLSSDNRSYHNKLHSQAVSLNCYEAIHHTELPISKEDKKAILLASLFHDANHSYGLLQDSANISNAITAFNNAHDCAKHQVTQEIIKKAKKLIKYTQYPYVAMSRHITWHCALVIRDADMMMAYEQDRVCADLHIGLFNEINNSRDHYFEPIMKFNYFLENNEQFLQRIVWNTRWAKKKAFNHNFPQRVKNMKALIESAK